MESRASQVAEIFCRTYAPSIVPTTATWFDVAKVHIHDMACIERLNSTLTCPISSRAGKSVVKAGREHLLQQAAIVLCHC